jgi:hypothetical protein
VTAYVADISPTFTNESGSGVVAIALAPATSIVEAGTNEVVAAVLSAEASVCLWFASGTKTLPFDATVSVAAAALPTPMHTAMRVSAAAGLQLATWLYVSNKADDTSPSGLAASGVFVPSPLV